MRSDHDEERFSLPPNRALAFGSGADRLQTFVPVNRNNLRVCLDGYITALSYLLNQVMRHRALKGRPTHEQSHRCRIAGKEHRGLTCGVTAPNDTDIFVDYRGRFRTRGAVKNTLSEQSLNAGGLKLAPIHTCR